MSSNGKASVETLVVWAGEWPYVKRGISQVRTTMLGAAQSVSAFFDFPAHLATAARYTHTADDFLTSRATRASAELQRQRWIVPATGITLASLFVVTKSMPWGSYVMFRNGMLTASALTVFMFPRELTILVDAALPFSISSIPEASKEGVKTDA